MSNRPFRALTPATPRIRGADSSLRRHRRRAAIFSATATASCIRPRFAVSLIRRRCSCRSTAIIFARASPIRSRSGRSPGRWLAASGVDDDLAEAVALAHDLGHTPFGHAGEGALESLHERVRRLRSQRPGVARRDPAGAPLRRYDGLDLTWETLEGIVKHNGPL